MPDFIGAKQGQSNHSEWAHVKAWLRGGHKAHKLLVIWGAHGVGKTWVTQQLAQHYGFRVRVATVDEQLNAAVVKLDCESMCSAIGKPNLLVYDDAHVMDRDAIGMLCEKFTSHEMPPTIVIVDDYWEPIPHPTRQLHAVVGPKTPQCVKLSPIKPAHLLMFFGHQMDSNMRGVADEVNGDARQYISRHFWYMKAALWCSSVDKRERTIFDRTRLLSGMDVNLLDPSAAKRPETWDERTSAMMEDPSMNLMMLHENAPRNRDDGHMDEVADSLETFSVMSTLTHQQSDFQMTEPAIAVCANTIHRGNPPAIFTQLPKFIKATNKRKREATAAAVEAAQARYVAATPAFNKAAAGAQLSEDEQRLLDEYFLHVRPAPFPDTDQDVDPKGETEIGRYKRARR